MEGERKMSIKAERKLMIKQEGDEGGKKSRERERLKERKRVMEGEEGRK